jgi:hypothetical protein
VDLHVGVVTTDLGTSTSNGEIAPDIGIPGAGGCSGPGDAGELTVNDAAVEGTFLSDVDGQRNFDGDLAATVRQMVRAGATGCGFEQPLAAMRAALDSNPANAGFLDADATLAVVFLTDEDDCSARDPRVFGPSTFRCTQFGVVCRDGGTTPDEMASPGVKDQCGPNTSADARLDDPALIRDFLVALKTDPRRIVVGSVMGNATPVEVQLRDGSPALVSSCSYDGADKLPNTTDDQAAAPAVRLQAFADLFLERGSTASICQNDLSPALANIGNQISLAMGSPCILQPLGEQPECVVEDLVGELATPIAPCPDAATCWTSSRIQPHARSAII